MWRKVLISLTACAAVLTVGGVGAAALSDASAGADPVPHCQRVLFDENSGNGPNYRITVCGNQLAKPTTGELQFIIDGGPLKNGAVVFINHVPAPSPSASGTLPAGTPSPAPTQSALPAASAALGYPNPNGPHFHCEQYTYPSGHGLNAWNCISGYGWLYGGVWGFASDFYQHPHPSSDEVVNETYFDQASPNGMSQTAQWKHRVIAVNDAAAKGLVEPFNWRISASNTNPPAPTTCLVLTGTNQGQQIPCSNEVQTSILDYWHQADVIPNQIPW